MAYSTEEIHRIALAESVRAFRQLRIDRSRRIDPFAALEMAGVLVMRRSLDRLAGAYLPGDPSNDGRPGVLINVSHPLSKQRYTAAHELCHHRRDREAIFDDETEWIARDQAPASDRERIAEAFAAWFLMPAELVRRILTKRGLQPNHLSPEDTYGMALDLGTSYTATVNHLVDLHLIDKAQRDRLLQIPPREIKRALGAVGVIADPWRDVWLVRSPNRDVALDVQEGDSVILEIAETPSSGYLWQPASISDGISLVRDEYQQGTNLAALGGFGTHRFLFRVDTPGRREVRLELRRPWQRGASPAEEYHLEISAEPKPSAGMVNPRRLVASLA